MPGNKIRSISICLSVCLSVHLSITRFRIFLAIFRKSSSLDDRIQHRPINQSNHAPFRCSNTLPTPAAAAVEQSVIDLYESRTRPRAVCTESLLPPVWQREHRGTQGSNSMKAKNLRSVWYDPRVTNMQSVLFVVQRTVSRPTGDTVLGARSLTNLPTCHS